MTLLFPLLMLLSAGVTVDPNLEGSGVSLPATYQSAEQRLEHIHRPDVTQVAGPGTPVTTRDEYVPGCPADLDVGSCQGQVAAALTACPEDFVVQNHTVITYEIATGEEVSRRYVPGYCPHDPTGRPAPVITVSVEDFQRLPLAGSGIGVDPIVEHYYVNLPIYFYSDNTPQVLTTQILGTHVLVEATPSSYRWDFGNMDVSAPVQPVARPRFSGRVEYIYRKSAYYDVTLTTAWSGRFSVDGGITWQMIAGTAATTDTFEQLPVAESIPLLVKPQVKTDQN